MKQAKSSSRKDGRARLYRLSLELITFYIGKISDLII